MAINNVFYANTGSGLYADLTAAFSAFSRAIPVCHNNIFDSNTTYGITNNGGAGTPLTNTNFPGVGANAFYNNTSGDALNYTYSSDEVRSSSFSGSPLRTPGTDFRLANNANGNLCRRTGRFSSMPILSGTAYPNIGAY